MQIAHDSDTPLFISLNAMGIGDYIFVKDAKQNTVRANIVYYRKKNKGKNFSKIFTCRTVTGGVKVWRVE